MTQELNPVLLQAQNLDLKARLQEAENRIHDLRSLASQSTIHMLQQTPGTEKLTAELEALKNHKNSTSGNNELSKLKQQIEELKKHLEESEEKNQGLEIELEWLKQQQNSASNPGSTEASGVFSRNESAPPPPPSSAPPTDALQALIQEERGKREAAEKELSTLRSKVASSTAENMKWKTTCSNLETDMAALRKEMLAMKKDSSNKNHDAGHVEMIKGLNEDLNSQLSSSTEKIRSAEEENKKLQEELKNTKVMLVRATQKMGKSAAAANNSEEQQGKIKALEEENKKLKNEIEDEKLDNESLTNEISTLRDSIAKIEEERAKERQAAAEAEFDRMLEGSDVEGKLRKQLREAEEARDKATKEAEKSKSEHTIMLRLKDKTLLQLNQTSEELLKAREHFEKREQELLRQLQEHGIKSPNGSSTPVTVNNGSFSSPERDQQVSKDAVQKQEALQKQRDSSDREKRKKELLEKLKAKTREDQATAEEIFTRTARAYDTLLKQLREAYRDDSGKGQEEVYYDCLWDYERRAWHMNNDYQSMRAIVDIKQSDMDAEIQRLREADETKLAILRMQLTDLGKTPQC